jgi:hypothetical protein
LVLSFILFDSFIQRPAEQARPSPDRLSHAAADSFGLSYRQPKFSGRSEANSRWSAQLHLGSWINESL